MRLVQTVAPTIEPVTLTECKAHLRIDGDETDTRLTALIEAARKQCEVLTRRQFITATYAYYVERFADLCLLPRPPLGAVSSITYVDSAGATQTLAASVYAVDAYAEPACVMLADGQTWPSTRDADEDRIIATYTAGYGATAASVPIGIRTGILYMIESMWDQNDYAYVTAERLLSPYKVGWLW